MRGRESDVYSYGVVLLELVTRKRAVDKSFPDSTDIVSWVRSVLSSSSNNNVEDMVTTIVDPILVDELLDSNLREQVIEVTELALSCTDKDPAKRPTMRDVVKLLDDVKYLARSCSSDSVR